MQKILALLVVTLSSVTLHAQGVWTEENIDPNTGLRTGVIEVNGNTFTIGPGAFLPDTDLSGADLERVNLSGANLILANLREGDLTGATLILATLSGADLFLADLSGGNLCSLLGGVSKGNYD